INKFDPIRLVFTRRDVISFKDIDSVKFSRGKSSCRAELNSDSDRIFRFLLNSATRDVHFFCLSWTSLQRFLDLFTRFL
ncbi:Uncharacterized protein DAT39_010288, partial [Clarias magur]